MAFGLLEPSPAARSWLLAGSEAASIFARSRGSWDGLQPGPVASAGTALTRILVEDARGPLPADCCACPAALTRADTWLGSATGTANRDPRGPPVRGPVAPWPAGWARWCGRQAAWIAQLVRSRMSAAAVCPAGTVPRVGFWPGRSEVKLSRGPCRESGVGSGVLCWPRRST